MIMEKRKLILRNFLSPGDLVLLTAAVRDLHLTHSGRFTTDVRSSCPELWEHNPYLTPLQEDDPGVEEIDCQYPLIHQSNAVPYHCLHGFTDFLSKRLGLAVHPTRFGGDIHLSDEERRWKSVVHELAGIDLPFWIVNAGGKFDFTIKWWDHRRYQRVVDHFRDRILFVQVGELGHYHPSLRHVIDLRGKTDLRQLVRLVYHSEGVLCGVTALMHLAAAVPARPGRPPARAAVIVAGGREPTHWEAYPHHQFIHTIGALSCCEAGGCWRARTKPLGDGEESDLPENLCRNVAGHLPRCMDMISAAEVIRRIEIYIRGGCGRFLRARERDAARRAIARSTDGLRFESTLNLATAPGELAKAARMARRSRVPSMSGRGILLLAHNEGDLDPALECIRSIRQMGSVIPIECWVNGGKDKTDLREFGRLGASMIHVRSVKPAAAPPRTRAEFWLHALEKTSLREVLAVDAGIRLLIPPDELFPAREFARAGVIMARDRPFGARPGVWKLCRLPLPTHTLNDSIMLLDRNRCWTALQLWRWIAHRMYFFAGYVDGDGGAAQLAFHAMHLRPKFSAAFEHAFAARPSMAPRVEASRSPTRP